jgi:hypothetical protein
MGPAGFEVQTGIFLIVMGILSFYLFSTQAFSKSLFANFNISFFFTAHPPLV